jgi:hypothetical protein
MDATLTALSRRLHAHTLIFEYPTYGLLKGITSSASEETINHYAQCAYSFVRNRFQWPIDRIIIYGHSIGTGAACHLASTQPIGALILQSPYTSMSNLVREKIGWLSNAISSPSWNNYEAIKHIECPILFIHGQRDLLIPSHHSQTLFNSLNNNQKKQIAILPGDDHNSISDPMILMNVQPFLSQYFQEPTEPMPRVEIDPALRDVPPMILASRETSQNKPNGAFGYVTSAFSISTNLAKSMFNSLAPDPSKQDGCRSRSSRDHHDNTIFK